MFAFARVLFLRLVMSMCLFLSLLLPRLQSFLVLLFCFASGFALFVSGFVTASVFAFVVTATVIVVVGVIALFLLMFLVCFCSCLLMSVNLCNCFWLL